MATTAACQPSCAHLSFKLWGGPEASRSTHPAEAAGRCCHVGADSQVLVWASQKQRQGSSKFGTEALHAACLGFGIRLFQCKVVAKLTALIGLPAVCADILHAHLQSSKWESALAGAAIHLRYQQRLDSEVGEGLWTDSVPVTVGFGFL